MADQELLYKELRRPEIKSALAEYLLLEFYLWLELEELHTGLLLDKLTKPSDEKTVISKLHVRMWLERMPHLALPSVKVATRFRQVLEDQIRLEYEGIRLQSITQESLELIESSETAKFPKLRRGAIRTTSFYSEKDFKKILEKFVNHFQNDVLHNIGLKERNRRNKI